MDRILTQQGMSLPVVGDGARATRHLDINRCSMTQEVCDAAERMGVRLDSVPPGHAIGMARIRKLWMYDHLRNLADHQRCQYNVWRRLRAVDVVGHLWFFFSLS